MVFQDSLLSLPSLEQAINRDFTVVNSEIELAEVVSLMGFDRANSERIVTDDWVSNELEAPRETNYVVVKESGQFLGVFSDRDLVRAIAKGIKLDSKVQFLDLFQPSEISLRLGDAENILTPLLLFRQNQIRHLPITDERGKLLGIITPKTILHALKLMNLFRLGTVGEVSKSPVISVPETSSVENIAQLSAENQAIGVVITGENSLPVGIISERQIIQTWALGMDLAQISAATVMGRLGHQLKPGDSLLEAYQQMQSDRRSLLLVSQDWGIGLNIITEMELLRSLEPIQMYKRLKRAQKSICQLETEKATILRQRNAELEKQVQQRTAELEENCTKLKLQAKQAALVNQIVQAMRGTLDLDQILQTTVNQLHEALNVSRCLIFRPDGEQKLAIDHVSEATSQEDSLIDIHCDFYTHYQTQLARGEALVLPRIESSLSPEIQTSAKRCNLRAIAILPLLYQETYIGGISLHECDREREWTVEEIAFVKNIADHCAIAIHQAELYQQIQTELQERKKAETALREKQQMLQLVMDNIPQFIFWKDRNSVYLGCNCNFARAAGFEHPEQVIGKTDYDLPWTKTESDWYRQCDRWVMTTNTPEYNITETQLQANNQERWLDTNKVPLHDAEGNVIGILGTYEDITERKLAEEALQQLNQELELKIRERTQELQQTVAKLAREIAQRRQVETQLRESKQELQSILDHSPAIIYVTDLDYRYLLINRQYENLFGVTKEEFIGKTIYACWPQDIAEVFVENNRQVMESENPIKVEEIAPHPDGLHTYISVKFPLKNSNGETYAICGISTDITDRKQAQEALREKEKRLSMALHAAKMGTWDWDVTTNKLIWSPGTELIFGFAPNTFSGTLVAYLNCVPESDRDSILNTINQTFEEKIPYELEHRCIWADGTIRWVASKGDVIYNQAGEAIGMSGVVMDITERKEAENALRDSEFKLRAIVENSKDSIFIKDQIGRYVLINPAGTKFLNRSLENVLGKTDRELFAPETAQPIWAVDRQVMRSGSTLITEEAIEIEDSKYIFVSTKSPYLSPEGELLGIIGVCRDITAYKEAQETMRRQLAAVEAASDGIAIINAAGEYTYINQSHAQIFGYNSAEELIGKTWQELYNCDEAKRIEEEIFPLLIQQGTWQGEAVAKKRDGTTFAEEISLTGLPEGGLICVCRDISDRKRTEEALRLRERAIAATNNGIIITDARKPDLPVIYVNSAFERMTGYSAREVLNKNCRFLQGSDTDQPGLTQLRAAIKQGESCTVVLRNYRKDGSLFWNELSISPIHGDDGTLTHFIGIQSDITERQEAAEEIRATTSRLATLIENLQLGILVKDEFKRVIMVNQAFCDLFNLSVSPANLIGADFSNFAQTHQHLFAESEQFLHHHLEVSQGKQVITDEEISMSDGRILERDYVPIFVQGNYTGHLWMYRDITERKQAEKQLKSSLKEKEILLKEIHHRVKNNLQVISSLLKLQSAYITDEDTLSLFTESYNRVRSMALIHEKLYQSQGLAKIDASTYISDLTENLFRSYNISPNHLQLQLQLEKIQLDIDTAIPCGLIINELVSNSFKYGFPKQKQGEIWVKFLQPEPGKISLTVADNGVGLPPDFDLSEVESLGLQLVSNLTEQLNGEIEIYSHQGTTFTITFNQPNKAEK
ncbi:PAS domain S-box protein [Oscillatoria salina]|uniref:PAS domain S-box protein n=1 Tax=Oscillatoria salina TaxID=331517 RepID=UPI001CC90589|nr:PAS domain S-box protein [Oscillatoria salina]MBZ8180358.1 PAS domain S-box protein [Oscillatoria salina IIICB1]